MNILNIFDYIYKSKTFILTLRLQFHGKYKRFLFYPEKTEINHVIY